MNDLISRKVVLKDLRFHRNEQNEIEGYVTTKNILAAPTVPSIPINEMVELRGKMYQAMQIINPEFGATLSPEAEAFNDGLREAIKLLNETIEVNTSNISPG